MQIYTAFTFYIFAPWLHHSTPKRLQRLQSLPQYFGSLLCFPVSLACHKYNRTCHTSQKLRRRTYLVLQFIQHIQETSQSNTPGMIVLVVDHSSSCSRSTAVKSSLRIKNILMLNQDFNIVRCSFSNRDNVTALIKYTRYYFS